jgi:hypothetical protein
VRLRGIGSRNNKASAHHVTGDSDINNPTQRNGRVRPPNEYTSRAQGRYKTGLSCHAYSTSGAGNEAQVQKKSLDKAANARRDDIEGKAGKEERGSEPTCTELNGDGDGADEAPPFPIEKTGVT